MKKILVAEDDKYLANAYRVKLSKEGFEVLIASDGAEALKLLETNIPDLIILDLIMPVKDGFTTLAEIMENPTLKLIPCIVASNLEQKEDITKAMSLGAKDYIVKSESSMEDILNKIIGVIGK
jgi:CheY-like chemotaxis protein